MPFLMGFAPFGFVGTMGACTSPGMASPARASRLVAVRFRADANGGGVDLCASHSACRSGDNAAPSATLPPITWVPLRRSACFLATAAVTAAAMKVAIAAG